MSIETPCIKELGRVLDAMYLHIDSLEGAGILCMSLAKTTVRDDKLQQKVLCAEICDTGDDGWCLESLQLKEREEDDDGKFHTLEITDL